MLIASSIKTLWVYSITNSQLRKLYTWSIWLPQRFMDIRFMFKFFRNIWLGNKLWNFFPHCGFLKPRRGPRGADHRKMSNCMYNVQYLFVFWRPKSALENIFGFPYTGCGIPRGSPPMIDAANGFDPDPNLKILTHNWVFLAKLWEELVLVFGLLWSFLTSQLIL